MKITKIQVGILNKFFNLLDEIKESHNLPGQMDRLLKNNITLKCCPHSLIAIMEHELEQFKRINLPSYHGMIRELQTEEYKEGSNNEPNKTTD
jgi:hypothetical protein